MKKTNIKVIRIDGGTQNRSELNNAVVSEYADAIKAGAEFPPVAIFYDGLDYWLADGFHRFHAYNAAGLASIPSEIHSGTKRDAWLYSLGANDTNGLRRSNDDKRSAVKAALSDEELSAWSDREIAVQCKVSNTFVGHVRASLTVNVDSEKPTERTFTTKHGTTATMQTSNIGKLQAVGIVPKVPESNPEPANDDGMLTEAELIAEMQETQAENVQLQERVELMASDDKAAEIDKLLTRISGLEGRINQLMMQVKTSADGEKYHATVIHKLRRLLGVEGHKEIIAAVTALVADRRLAA